MSASTPERRIGITLGDCAGIGPEIVELALKSGRVPDSTEYVVIGRQPNCNPGGPTPETARAAAAALEEAVTLVRRGELAAIVTGPVHKARMYEIGFRFPGQTEFFATRCNVKDFAMCLTGGKLTVALVTAHVPLRKVPRALQQAEILRVGLLLAKFLRSRGINAPRVAVAGLNPHAGESGKLGGEEIEIIAPAIEQLNSSLVTRHSSLMTRAHECHAPTLIFDHEMAAYSTPRYNNVWGYWSCREQLVLFWFFPPSLISSLPH